MKKILYILTIIFVLPFCLILTACDKDKEPNLYTISISSNVEHGTITVDRTRAEAGQTISIEIIADNGYELEENSLKYNETIIIDNSFVMPSEDVIISANFVLIESGENPPTDVEKYNVTSYSSSTGSVYTSFSKYTADYLVELKVLATEGYKLEEGSIKINGEPIVGTSFVMPKHDVVITANFIKITHSITYHIDTNTTNNNSLTVIEEVDNKQYELLTAEKEGFLFEGWYLEDNFITKVETIENVKQDLNLYPKFLDASFTTGLIFELSNSSYIVKSYNGTENNVIIPSTYLNKSVEKIGDEAFKLSEITQINIPNSIKIIGEKSFESCAKLTTVNFANQSNLTLINDYTFHGCAKLNNLNLPNSLSTIGKHAFEGCKALSRLEIPNSVENINEYAFNNCISLENITFAENSTLENIEKDAFQYCTSLETIVLPNSLIEIGDYCFGYCSKLINITFSSKLEKIGMSCFYSCPKLVNITLPDSLLEIKNYAFQYCTGLTSITIPKLVSTIGAQIHLPTAHHLQK